MWYLGCSGLLMSASTRVLKKCRIHSVGRQDDISDHRAADEDIIHRDLQAREDMHVHEKFAGDRSDSKTSYARNWRTRWGNLWGSTTVMLSSLTLWNWSTEWSLPWRRRPFFNSTMTSWLMRDLKKDKKSCGKERLWKWGHCNPMIDELNQDRENIPSSLRKRKG